MTALAKAYKPKELSIEAFGLYEQFRPDVPAGTKGWGAKGVLTCARSGDGETTIVRPRRSLAVLTAGLCFRRRRAA